MCLYMYNQVLDKRKQKKKNTSKSKLHECINKIIEHGNDLLTCIAQTFILSRLSEHNPPYYIKYFDIFEMDTTHFKLSILKGTALYHKGIYTVVKSVQRSRSARQPSITLTYAFFKLLHQWLPNLEWQPCIWTPYSSFFQLNILYLKIEITLQRKLSILEKYWFNSLESSNVDIRIFLNQIKCLSQHC